MKSLALKAEARRLSELRGYEILDTAPEEAFERAVRMAAQIFQVPVSTVTFVDEFRQWFKASVGTTFRETPRQHSYCALTIQQDGVFVIEDAGVDPRLTQAPVLVDERPIRFYAGAPLRSATGVKLGALCVIDFVPRQFGLAEQKVLADLAETVMDSLALRKMTRRTDTEKYSRKATERMLTRQQHLLHRLGGSLEGVIRERTTDLIKANDCLRAEMLKRELADIELQRAKEEAEKANAAKSEFLSRMSHELRTPLNAILGFGQILQSPIDDEGRYDCATQVVGAGRHLLSLINEVLDIARIEAGRMEIATEPVAVANAVAETLDLIRPLAEGRGTRIEVAPAVRGAHCVLADRQRFKQVLLNLISNAVKYGPEGGKTVIDCRAERTRMLRLCVSNEGAGFSTEQVERLFVPFDRLGAERSEVQGTGLGLALSRRLIEAMGGKIGVKTSPGEGSTFWIRLPLSQLADSCLASPGDGSPGDDQARAIPNAALHASCSILCIEDNLSNMRVIQQALAPCREVRVLTARSAAEGLALARARRPDLILLDLHLPDRPGWEVLRQLRGEKATRRIPVVAISADATPTSVDRLMAAGAQGYLTKPLNIASLYKLVPEVARAPVASLGSAPSTVCAA